MADVGSYDDLISASKCSLTIGGNTYLMKTVLSLKIHRAKFRNATPSGPSITYGTGDNGLDGTILATTSEIESLVDLTKRDDSGKLTSNVCSLGLKSIDGTETKTLTFDGEMPDLELTQDGEDGKMIFTFHIDITDDTVVVT